MEPKNYLIVGGTSGIGGALAEALSKEGHQLFIVSRSEAPDLPEGAKHLKADILDTQIDLSNFLPEVLHGMAYCTRSGMYHWRLHSVCARRLDHPYRSSIHFWGSLICVPNSIRAW